jgi:hypothetical protein
MKNIISLSSLILGVIFSVSAQDTDEIGDNRHIDMSNSRVVEEDLTEQFLAIPMYNLMYKDPVTNYAGAQIKTIAQELKTSNPSSVFIDTGYIPDIYAFPASFSYDGTSLVAQFEMEIDHGLSEGDQIKIIDKMGSHHPVVTNVIDHNSFEVELIFEPENPFVYGHFVEDLHKIDYESLLGLNIAVTQDMVRKVQWLEERIEKMEQLIDGLTEGN